MDLVFDVNLAIVNVIASLFSRMEYSYAIFDRSIKLNFLERKALHEHVLLNHSLA